MSFLKKLIWGELSEDIGDLNVGNWGLGDFLEKEGEDLAGVESGDVDIFAKDGMEIDAEEELESEPEVNTPTNLNSSAINKPLVPSNGKLIESFVKKTNKKKLGGASLNKLSSSDNVLVQKSTKQTREELIIENEPKVPQIPQKPPQEKDLSLKLISYSDGEKVYKLSDLFIPKDDKIIKKIEKYNNKIMSISERDKQDKEKEQMSNIPGKKEISDAEEIKHLIKKTKRNQRYTKINVTYNEKFFDRTFFLENIGADRLAQVTDSLLANMENAEKAQQEVSQFHANYNSQKTEIRNEGMLKTIRVDEDKLVDPVLVERNLFNSLFEVRKKLEENRKRNAFPEEIDGLDLNIQPIKISNDLKIMEGDSSLMNETALTPNEDDFENNIVGQFNKSLKETINPEQINSEEDITPEFKLFDLENSELFKQPEETYHRNAKQKEKKIFTQNIGDVYMHDDNNIDNGNEDEGIDINKMIQDEDDLQLEKIENVENVLNIKSTVKPLTNSSFFKSQQLQVNKFDNPYEKKTNKINFEFIKEREKTDAFQLYDKIKRKRHRSQGYFNENFLLGKYRDALLIDCKNINKNFIELSKKIYDMNDYNMNFEILTESTVKKDQPKEQNKDSELSKQQQNQSAGEDFFNYTQKLLPPASAQQTSLKIGKAKGNLLTHAKCAYNLTYNKINLSYEDLKDFHRPNFCKYLTQEKKKRNFSITISADKYNISAADSKCKKYDIIILTRNYLKKREKKRISKNIQYMNAYEIFKDRSKLSLIDGKYCTFEHIDEYPLFISNFGMASKLKRFLYTPKLFHANVVNPNTKLNEVEMKSYQMIGPHGLQILLQPGQKLPLIGQIETNEYKGLSVIDNKMFRAPTFYEKFSNPVVIKYDAINNVNNESRNKKAKKPQNNNSTVQQQKKYYNYLLTFKRSKEGGENFFLRELEHHYVVAQEEPKIEVHPPQSKQYNMFLKNKIKTYTYKVYDHIGYKAGINFKFFTNLFPTVTEQILKKNFKEMKIEIDKNICYFTKNPNEDNQTLITPENICQFESCQHGIYKLREVGIKNLTNPDKISYAVNKFNSQETDSKKKYYSKIIEEELLTTPWNITQNFIQSKQIKGMLAIKGIGDPSNGTGGYSFLKMPVKSYNNNVTIKEEMDILKNQNKNIKTVTGTDADLRKLNKEEIKYKLIQLGENEDNINKLSRWGRVAALRYKSSKAAELGYEGDITKYARGSRMSSKVQREAYQKQINEVFKKQIQYIVNDQLDLSDDESSDDEEILGSEFTINNRNLQDNLSTSLEKQTDTERRKSMNFMRNEIYPNAKKRRLGGDNPKKITNKGQGDNSIMKLYQKTPNNLSQQQALPEEGATKIKFDIKSSEMANLLKKKRKNPQSFDNVYEYEMDKTTSILSRKRRDTPEKMFNEVVEDIVDSCIKFDQTKVFHQAVKKKDYPDYYDIVKEPIDLSTMKNKTKRNEYLTIERFVDDVNLMVHNARMYNGDNHDVTKQAEKIRDLAMLKIRE
jgi:hypothetical protein